MTKSTHSFSPTLSPSTLSFSGFPDALPPLTPFKSPYSTRTDDSFESSPINFKEGLPSSPSAFPDYSPVAPTTPIQNRHTILDDSDSPFGDDMDFNSLSSSFNRPLPDQSAFDTSVSSSSYQRSPPCPPTPIRKPTWSQEGAKTSGKLVRQSSLCTTKVLLTLPSESNEKFGYFQSNEQSQFFNKFTNLGWIGSGVFGEVYKMRSHIDNRVYAIKKSKRQFRSKRDRDRLLQEVRIYESMAKNCPDHCEHIIKYYSAWQEDGYFFTQTELCERGNLKDVLEALPTDTIIPEDTVWAILHDATKGLSYIHEAKFVHLDIKPQNIFVSEKGLLKIGDFGTSVSIGQKEDGLEGDIFYMAKELLTSHEKLPSADIFSLGIMLYEIISGQGLPQEGEAWHNLREGRFPPLFKNYSNELQHVIHAMMHSDPSLRPSAQMILCVRQVQESSINRDPFIMLNAPVCDMFNTVKTKLFDAGPLDTPTNKSHGSFHWE